MGEPTISLRDVKERTATTSVYAEFYEVAPVPMMGLTVPERDALVEAVEATQGPEGCMFCGRPKNWPGPHEDDCPAGRFTEEGT